MSQYSSPWKKLGLNARAVTSGLSRRRKAPSEVDKLPSMKEISNMKLPEFDDYSVDFDGQFGKGTKRPNKRNSRRTK